MGSAAGLFVSTVAPEEWTEDPDLPGTEMHELVKADGVWVGLTRILVADAPIPWMPEQRETAHVLEGSVRIEFEDRPDLLLGPGDIVSFPAGLSMVWHVTVPFKELWFFA